MIDANNPAEILNSFGVCANHLMCIASVPGASLSDYEDTEVIVDKGEEGSEATKTEEGKENGLAAEEDGEAKGDDGEVDPDSLVS